MKILAIETSCDETAAAVVTGNQDGSVEILSQKIATSLALHAQTGGIIPEVAARNQIHYIIPVIAQALEDAGIPFTKDKKPDIDAIAITYGPGLIGSLLVGVETIKTLAYVWDVPIIPVNHLFGHIYANWLMADSLWLMGENSNHKAKRAISDKPYAKLPEFPAIALVVSGGHTDLVLMKSHTDVTWLGGTRDDAAGEAFDKIGRLLGLPYPAGPKIEQLAQEGSPKTFRLPRPLKYEGGYDFSFSGLKTAALREVQKVKTLTPTLIKDLCRGVQDAIIDVLAYKTFKAAEEFQGKSVLLSGGVAANQKLRETFQQYAISHMPYASVFVPTKTLCTDNAAMIGAAAIFRNDEKNWDEITANPELYFD